MPTELRRRISKSQVLTEIKNVIFVLLGCLLLAFADAAFLTPCNIVSGGVASVGIIVNYYVEPLIHFDITDFVIDGVQVILWIVGLSPSAKSFHSTPWWLLWPTPFSTRSFIGSLAFGNF
jgi:uncharacterized membrane-anchored protein YitT (DUF2179 family)